MPFDSTTVPSRALLEMLQVARGIIDTPRKWTRGKYRSGDGRLCAMAAVDAACLRLQASGWDACCAKKVLHEVAVDRGYVNMVHLNDDRDHATVMETFDEAIRRTGANVHAI